MLVFTSLVLAILVLRKLEVVRSGKTPRQAGWSISLVFLRLLYPIFTNPKLRDAPVYYSMFGYSWFGEYIRKHKMGIGVHRTQTFKLSTYVPGVPHLSNSNDKLYPGGQILYIICTVYLVYVARNIAVLSVNGAIRPQLSMHVSVSPWLSV